MKKYSFTILFALAAVALVPVISGAKLSNSVHEVKKAVATDSIATAVEAKKNSFAAVYDLLHLEAKGLSRSTYELALKGFEKLKAQGKVKHNKLSIADFSQPSTQKRLYIIDFDHQQLLFNTLVAHGKNTGTLMATNFSNTNSSNQSSLGFYVTAETYMGKHGLSMRMDGVENNLNSNARDRAIVLHGADYVSENTAKAMGYIGRSWGCPAVNPRENKPIIDAIKDGSVLFIYNPRYEKLTNFFNDTEEVQ